MSRYDRNRNKQSNKSTFIFAIFFSLLIGISGTYYVVENYNRDKADPPRVSGSELSPESAGLAALQDGSAVPVEKDSERLHPITTALPSQADAGEGQLPDLLSSDSFVRAELIKLLPGLAQWLNFDQLIRRYMQIANDFAQGQRVTKHVSFLRQDEAFTVQQGENGLIIAPKSFRRYNVLAETIQAINAKSAAATYIKLRPLLLQVFAEFAYPKDVSMESIIKKAAGEIIAAPVLEGDIYVTRPSMYYKYADPSLEALSPVKKQMLRMGAENTKIIQNKCREFLVELAKSAI